MRKVMDRKTKQNLFVTMVGISWFVALIKLPSVLAFAGRLVALMLPVIAGGILALFVSVPANGVERRLRRIWGKAKRTRKNRKHSKNFRKCRCYISCITWNRRRRWFNTRAIYNYK